MVFPCYLKAKSDLDSWKQWALEPACLGSNCGSPSYYLLNLYTLAAVLLLSHP